MCLHLPWVRAEGKLLRVSALSSRSPRVAGVRLSHRGGANLRSFFRPVCEDSPRPTRLSEVQSRRKTKMCQPYLTRSASRLRLRCLEEIFLLRRGRVRPGRTVKAWDKWAKEEMSAALNGGRGVILGVQ